MAIKISEIKSLLKEHNLLVDIIGNTNLSFEYISYNSKDIESDSLFFCKGNFKLTYVYDAINNGATCVVTQKEIESVENQIIVKDIQKAMSLISAAYFDFPQNNLKIVAFTGTKGKTTSAYFMRDAIQQNTKNTVALFSTIDTIVGSQKDETFKSNLTTPESLDLFRNMRNAVNNGIKYLVMEVSSQAFKKNRVYGLNYDIGVFLNISEDHIGENEHPTFEDYLYCKKQLMLNSTYCVINAETDYLNQIKETALSTSISDQVFLYARNGTKLNDTVNLDFDFDNFDGEVKLTALSKKAKDLEIDNLYLIGVPGDFNESNAVSAIISGRLLDLDKNEIGSGIEKTKIPGRMEIYRSQKHGLICVDYAHNYASVTALIRFLKRNNNNTNNVSLVVGSPGNKGIDRRKGFGEAIGEIVNVAYLTTDDPSFEDPKQIADEIMKYINNPSVDVKYELNRINAIRLSINNSKENDITVIAGKGRDPYQKVNGVDVPYETDSVVVKKYLEEIENDE